MEKFMTLKEYLIHFTIVWVIYIISIIKTIHYYERSRGRYRNAVERAVKEIYKLRGQQKTRSDIRDDLMGGNDETKNR